MSLLGNHADSISLTVSTAVFYEYGLTSAREVRQYWGRPLNVPSALFFANRYMCLISRIVLLSAMFAEPSEVMLGSSLVFRCLRSHCSSCDHIAVCCQSLRSVVWRYPALSSCRSIRAGTSVCQHSYDAVFSRDSSPQPCRLRF
ncbi:uncharacterized protein B0H18DRAFT_672223 [Fomitopsis serialis]|uniref:uncharacterized protein n=1 Tax=Fomitopsis serialis TaxID=139415 RepID=UPI002007CBAA|nr:uncharacterized protein B0H18DRAFT_672223 [Neoantrodia serialis]KAH9932945.1 hypothetical protein B0H18DRAFT_672223 [Neoantrodia serialis]